MTSKKKPITNKQNSKQLSKKKPGKKNSLIPKDPNKNISNRNTSHTRKKWQKYLDNDELYKDAYESKSPKKPAIKKIPKVRTRKKIVNYKESDDVQMSFVEHLEELRKRFINILIIFGLFAIIAFSLSEYLVALLQSPYIETGEKLITTRPTGAFLTRLKVSLMASLVLSIPLILHQIWLFIFPALGSKFRKMGIWLLLFAFVLFLGGVVFNFFVVLPLVLNALHNIVWPGVQILYNIDDYYDFVLLTSIMFGAIFELPILVLIFVRIGILSYLFLIKQWRYSLVVGAVIAAILTPPDAFSLIMMLIPMVLLYLFSIGVAFIFRLKD